MFPEILTPDEHRPRKQQQPSIIWTKDGRRITIFPNGETQTLLSNGTILSTNKHDRGTWVKKPCSETEYIPPDPLLQEFVQEKMKHKTAREVAVYNHKHMHKKWQVELQDSILDKMDRGKYVQ